jgi:hypothetical protein
MGFLSNIWKTVDVWLPDERQQNMRKGHEFESHVASLFTMKKDYFSIVQWTTDHSDKRQGIRVESDSTPDMVIRYKPKDMVFAVECKWRANSYYNNQTRMHVVKWAEPYQIRQYQKFSEEHSVPVYIVIGLGGEPSNPEDMFCLPLSMAKYPELFGGLIERFRRPSPNTPFSWRDGTLR